jgi:uncharacterized protein YndB with AHSA1/START domain
MKLEPLVFSATVPIKPDAAFDLFTSRMGRWWPLIDHSIYTVNAETCVVETFPGGRVYEKSRTGEIHEWGTVLIVDKPHRIVMTWHPGGGPEAATEVEVTFTPSGSGTLVTLEHRKWENLAEAAEAAHTGYANGWPYVFGQRFVQAANAENR